MTKTIKNTCQKKKNKKNQKMKEKIYPFKQNNH